ncbi:MAG: hypothetical protein L6V88_03850 [Anaerotruncus sp.]|nr:MAG: hypothetical protein L6V88_03850 [Anaerotruncus sp.]
MTVIDLAGDVNLSCCVYRKYSEYLSDDAYSVNHDVKKTSSHRLSLMLITAW